MPSTRKLAEQAFRNFYDGDTPGPVAIETWVRVVNSVVEAIASGRAAELLWPPPELNLQDTAGLRAVYLQPESVGIMPCLVAEIANGPKRFMRIWLRNPVGIEWGWVLGATAITLWEMPGTDF